MEPLQEEMLGTAGRSIWVLQAAVGFVLLIACANLANLLLARAESRHREFAVRTAIGATRWRLLRQFMTEGVLLSLVGGVLGVVLARVGVSALLRAYPASLPRTSEVAVDLPVLLFTLGVAMATGLLVGLAPLMHTRVKGLVTALKEGGAKGATSAARHHVRRGLVMAEVALAVMLVIGAGLLLRTVYNLTQVDGGFDRSRLVTFSMTLPQATSTGTRLACRRTSVCSRTLRAVPGVQGATAMTGLPPNRPLNANDTDIDGYTAPPEGPFENVDYYQGVMSDYFETMGIPIVQGRSFERADAASTGTGRDRQRDDGQHVLERKEPDRTAASSVLWRSDPLVHRGRRRQGRQAGRDRSEDRNRVLSVHRPGRQPGPWRPGDDERRPADDAVASRRWPRRSSGRSATWIRSVPVVRLQGMDGVFAESIRRPRLLAQLIGAFAGLALLLAAVGTYGVLSYMVAERRREIGIRLALGADHSRVLGQVMKQGLVLTAVGLVAGLAGAFGVNRLIASLLFGVQPTDTTTMIVVVATIAGVAAIACWVPAWRASRLDPNVVLRED